MSAPLPIAVDERPVLVSHRLCPYVQRAAIVLAEKGVDFQRIDIDLAAKPAWFLALSPLGKTPMLLVRDGQDVAPLASATLNQIWQLYTARDEAAFDAARGGLRQRFEQLDAALHAAGPWFGGAAFSVVDAAFAPVFRYFEVIDDEGLFAALPRLAAWRAALAARPSVHGAVGADYAPRLREFIVRQRGWLGARFEAPAAVSAAP